MNIRILGAHNIESQDSRCVSLLIDDVLAIDAGALTSSLSFPAQQKLKAVLLTHQHYDHVRDIPTIGMNFLLHENDLEIYITQPVFETLTAHLLNNILYPDFTDRPPEKPTLHFTVIESGRQVQIAGYNILAVPVNHSVTTVGFQIISPDGKMLFHTSDTGPGLNDCWQQVSPELLITEVTAPNMYEEFAKQSGHLTPSLLHKELECFRQLKGYLPQVILVHMNPLDENTIEAEIAAVARSLGTTIRLGYEGMLIHL